MNRKLIQSVFWILVGVFVIIACTMFIPTLNGLLIRFIILPAGVVLAGLGVTLIVLTFKTKVAGRPKAFMILTGASAVGIPVFVILHNLVYALLILWFGEDFWGASGDEPVFFIIAIIVCPIGFLVGAVGSVVLAIKNKRAKYSS